MKIILIEHFKILFTVMEIAIGEYDCDFEKMIGAADKKYYEERDLNDLEKLRETTENIIRSTINENCDIDKSVQVFKFTEKNDLKPNAVYNPNMTESKFHVDNPNQAASLFMQFIVLFGRYFKASIRNRVRIALHIHIYLTCNKK